VRVLGDRQPDLGIGMGMGMGMGTQAKAKQREAKAEAEAGLLLCADTRNHDATLLCTYMYTRAQTAAAAATCRLLGLWTRSRASLRVCSCGSRTCGLADLDLVLWGYQKQRQRQRHALESSLLAHSRTAPALELHAQAHDNRQLTINDHHCARDTLAAHAGATTFCFCFCAVLSCHCVGTCKHNACRNARFAERAAPSCCSIHNGRPARPSGQSI
jgi:hypothetical protein